MVDVVSTWLGSLPRLTGAPHRAQKRLPSGFC
jgi:hypothetical protein